MVVDGLAARAGVKQGREQAEAWLAPATLGGQEVLLVKPLTFMNRSGVAVERLLSDQGGSPQDLIVVLDDVALPLDVLRIRERGSHGGHNGLRSLIDVLANDEFPRVRLGVGPPSGTAAAPAGGEPPEPTFDMADYVLSPFPPEEVLIVQELVGRAGDAVLCLLEQGPAAAMNAFNGPRKA